MSKRGERGKPRVQQGTRNPSQRTPSTGTMDIPMDQFVVHRYSHPSLQGGRGGGYIAPSGRGQYGQPPSRSILDDSPPASSTPSPSCPSSSTMTPQSTPRPLMEAPLPLHHPQMNAPPYVNQLSGCQIPSQQEHYQQIADRTAAYGMSNSSFIMPPQAMVQPPPPPQQQQQRQHQWKPNLVSLIEKLEKLGCIVVRVYLKREQPENGFAAILADGTKEPELTAAKKELFRMGEQWYTKRYNASDRRPISTFSLPFLKARSIEPLITTSPGFAWALYYCTLCDFHLKDIQHIVEHLPSHMKEENRQTMRNELKDKLPAMTEAQRAALKNAIEDAAAKHIDEERKMMLESLLPEIKESLVSAVNEACAGDESEITIDIDEFGSVKSGVVHAESDINISLDVKEKEREFFIVRFAEHLQKCASWLEVKATDGICTCRVQGRYKGVPVTVDWRNREAVEFSELLHKYTQLQPYMLTLRAAVHYWAKVCELTIRARLRSQYAVPVCMLDVMLFHSMQKPSCLASTKQEALLPVIHEMRGLRHDAGRLPTVSELKLYNLPQADDIVAPFMDFLYFYSKVELKLQTIIQITTSAPTPKSDTKFSRKQLIVIDPTRENRLISPMHRHFQIFFFNCFFTSFVYLRVPQTREDGALIDIQLYQMVCKSPSKPPPAEDTKVGEQKAETGVSESDANAEPLDVASTLDEEESISKAEDSTATEQDAADDSVAGDSIERASVSSMCTANAETTESELLIEHPGQAIREIANESGNSIDAQQAQRRVRESLSLSLSSTDYDSDATPPSSRAGAADPDNTFLPPLVSAALIPPLPTSYALDRPRMHLSVLTASVPVSDDFAESRVYANKSHAVVIFEKILLKSEKEEEPRLELEHVSGGLRTELYRLRGVGGGGETALLSIGLAKLDMKLKRDHTGKRTRPKHGQVDSSGVVYVDFQPARHKQPTRVVAACAPDKHMPHRDFEDFLKRVTAAAEHYDRDVIIVGHFNVGHKEVWNYPAAELGRRQKMFVTWMSVESLQGHVAGEEVIVLTRDCKVKEGAVKLEGERTGMRLEIEFKGLSCRKKRNRASTTEPGKEVGIAADDKMRIRDDKEAKVAPKDNGAVEKAAEKMSVHNTEETVEVPKGRGAAMALKRYLKEKEEIERRQKIDAVEKESLSKKKGSSTSETVASGSGVSSGQRPRSKAFDKWITKEEEAARKKKQAELEAEAKKQLEEMEQERLRKERKKERREARREEKREKLMKRERKQEEIEEKRRMKKEQSQQQLEEEEEEESDQLEDIEVLVHGIPVNEATDADYELEGHLVYPKDSIRDIPPAQELPEEVRMEIASHDIARPLLLISDDEDDSTLVETTQATPTGPALKESASSKKKPRKRRKRKSDKVATPFADQSQEAELATDDTLASRLANEMADASLEEKESEAEQTDEPSTSDEKRTSSPISTSPPTRVDFPGTEFGYEIPSKKDRELRDQKAQRAEARDKERERERRERERQERKRAQEMQQIGEQERVVLPADSSSKSANIATVEELFHEIRNYDAAKVAELLLHLNVEDFLYSLEKRWDLTGGFMCEPHCTSCDSPKHSIDECPQLEVPEVKEISRDHWKPFFTTEISNIIQKGYDENRISGKRQEILDQTLKELTHAIELEMGDIVRLNLFGSSRNGFGSVKSDMDVCFRFVEAEEKKLGGQLRSSDTELQAILNIENILKRSPDFRFVHAIPQAKVPIVKFSTASGKIDGDISYYNELALHNTEMLRTYCEWTMDNKLAKLGMFVKSWAQRCDIGDASKGSLSSYAYILLLIHFLQRTDPPVLPVLQEEGDAVEEMVGGWNVYYHNGTPNPDWSRNEKDVGELFVDFLDYFARFDWAGEVVQMRQTRRLSKLEKSWRKNICIEDPFDLNHNLGSGVSTRMAAYIRKTFVNSREVFLKLKVRKEFCKMLKKDEDLPIPADSSNIVSYGKELLTRCKVAGGVPKDRTCYKCGKHGHYAESCPSSSRPGGTARAWQLNGPSYGGRFAARGAGRAGNDRTAPKPSPRTKPDDRRNNPKEKQRALNGAMSEQ